VKNVRLIANPYSMIFFISSKKSRNNQMIFNE
jgi:hypothetical protein